MDYILDVLKSCNWQTIAAMFAICWYFTHELRREMKELHKDMREQGQRIDRLYVMFVDLLKEGRK